MRTRRIPIPFCAGFVLSAATILGISTAQVIHRTKPYPYSMWGSDSLFIGGGLAVDNPNKNVVVKWKTAYETICTGEVSFMLPSIPDSAMFLFHNLVEQFPLDSLSIDLGVFPARTPITFRYMSTDTFLSCERVHGDLLYSGQNRTGIDEYVSTCTPSGSYGLRYAAVGRIDPDSVEMGIDGNQALSYRAVLFSVSNVVITGLEKFQVSRPRAEPPETTFLDPMTVSLSVPTEGNIVIVGADTTNPLANGDSFTVYYTTDTTDPRTSSSRALYTAPILLTATTTLNAFATVEGDTNWWDSEVLTQVYTRDQTHVARHRGFPMPGSDCGGGYVFYSIDGRVIRGNSAGRAPKPGVYLARAVRPEISGGVRRVLVAR